MRRRFCVFFVDVFFLHIWQVISGEPLRKMMGPKVEGEGGDEMDEGGVLEGRSGGLDLGANVESSPGMRSEVSTLHFFVYLGFSYSSCYQYISPFSYSPKLERKVIPLVKL